MVSDRSVRFGKDIFIENPYKVKVGSGSFINNGVHIYTGVHNSSLVIIGNNVGIGLDSCIVTNSHHIGASNKRWAEDYSESITIEDGVWIGANVTVLPGVTIKKGGVIAAGAVVTESTEPNAVYAGIPARKIRDLS